MGRVIEWAGRGVGCVAAAVTSFLWISAIWFPTDGMTISGVSLLPLALMMALAALVATIASYHGHATVLVVVSFLSFVPIGFALLEAEHFLRYAGMLNIVLAVAAGLIAIGRSMEQTS